MSWFYLASAALCTAFVTFVVVAYRREWSWTGFTTGEDVPQRKTLWEWLQLLLIPLALTAAAFLLNQLQADREQRREDQRLSSERRSALETSRERALGTYLDQMGRWVLDRGLLASGYGSAPRVHARALTLRVLGQLDGVRKAAVVQYLREAQLIRWRNAIIDLRGADLRHAVFAGANVSRIRLSAARLSDADFQGADITSSRFNAADLRGANFARARGGVLVVGERRRTEFRAAKLTDAVFDDASLDAANFEGADLRGSSFVRAALSAAWLSRACLSGADFRSADLRYAALDALGHRVRLDRARLVGAVGAGASPSRVLTLFPDGWRRASGLWMRADPAKRSCAPYPA